MAIPVKLEIFEGPLDLLLHLIEKHKIDIYDIPIVLVTEQYLAYVSQLQAEHLEVMSEFLVMAATLLRIKSRMLLPKQAEDAEEEDPRQELLERLIAYKAYQYLAQELRGREQAAAGLAFHKKDLPKELAAYRETPDLHTLLSEVTLQKLSVIFEETLRRQTDKIDPIRSRFRKIEKEPVRLSDKLLFIRAYAKEHKRFYFRRLLEDAGSRTEVVVTFLGILELMKSGTLFITQEFLFDDILVEYKETAEDG